MTRRGMADARPSSAPGQRPGGGREPEATELTEAIARQAAARGVGGLVNQGDPVGYGPLAVPELAEAASRTGDQGVNQGPGQG
jgi:hypothetical protein